MIRILILDDDLGRHAQFRDRLNSHGIVGTHVETADECIKQLQKNGPWDVCFLDHDLGGQTFVHSGVGTGYEVASWIAANPKKCPRNVIVHSFNPSGAQNMLHVLPPQSRYIPGVWTVVHKASFDKIIKENIV